MMGMACKLTCKTAFVPDFVKSTSCTVDVAAACSSCGRSSGKINGQTYDCAGCGYEGGPGPGLLPGQVRVRHGPFMDEDSVCDISRGLRRDGYLQWLLYLCSLDSCVPGGQGR